MPSSPLASTNKILLIEDNPGDARLVEIFLMESDLTNCQVINKTSLGDALAVLHSGDNFAAILLDLSLPDSRGLTTLETVVSQFPHNNIIVLTGFADKEMGVKAVQMGAQDYLVKGEFDSGSLTKTLRFSIERNKVLKRLEETQRIAHFGSWEYFAATDTFDATDELYRIFGCTSSEKESGFSPFETLRPLQEEAAEKGRLKKDLKIRRKNDTFRYVFVQCDVQQDENGQLTCQGIIQDITERKLAEQEAIKSQERYQEIFTQSRDALFICSIDGKIIDFNQATLELFGYDAKDLTDIQNVHALYQPVERKNEFLLKLKNQKSVKDFDIKIVNKKGELRECLVSANITVTDDFVGYNCILRDMTELRQAEELKKARDLAQQSAQMKEQFVASISHEMRTPMNAILGMSNLLVQMDLEGEQFNLVKSIKQSSEILLGVVNDILEVSEIQNGKVVFENQPFDLHEVLGNLVNVMQYKAQEKDLYLEVIMDDDIPQHIRGDQLRLNQILYNLVGNAIKFTDKGYVKVFLKKLHDIGENSLQIKFEIEDTGIGIPSDKIEAAFETFTRIRQKDRLFEGTGLGLSICKNLVELQGGKISARSEEGKGSTFFFDLIFEIAEPEAKAENTFSDVPELPAEETFSLLLVEDHKMNQLVARKTLERKWGNIQITVADNGQIAIDLLREKDFDLVLMDIQMPVMDGYEATKFIRLHFPPEKSSMKILAMTAHAHVAKDEKFKEYGMDDYVLKPFKPEELFYKISKYVKR